MWKFWSSLWLYWALSLTLLSLLGGVVPAGCITLGIYLFKGAPALSGDVSAALYDIGLFWFGIMWCALLPVALLTAIRYLFGRCFHHRCLHLFSCDGKERIVPVRMGDCVKLWRKWLFFTVWAVAAQVLMVVAVATVLGLNGHPLAWFDIYWLYLFMLIAGGGILPMMPLRCKTVKVAPC